MVIVPNRIGQLGNQLFHIAHFAASGVENNFKVFFCSFEFPLQNFPNINSNSFLEVFQASALKNKWQYRVFKVLRIIFPSSIVHKNFVSLSPPYLDTGSSEFVRDARNKITICEGFGFRDIANIKKHKKQIINLFEFSKQITDIVDSYIIFNAIPGDCVVVGFHVRRGDYREFQGGRFFINDNHWVTVIHDVRSQIESKGRRFFGIIFSNENVDQFLDANDDLILAPGGLFTDLCMLQRCNLIVAPPSTYSGWASFSGAVPILHLDRDSREISIENSQVVSW